MVRRMVRRQGQRRTASLYEHREAAETRYKRYAQETEHLLAAAHAAQDMGRWSEAATHLQAAAATLCAMQGCARELSLIYLISGE